jgi:hypothetical protein
MLQQTKLINYRLESKVGVKYNKENVLWTYSINRTSKCRIRCQNTQICKLGKKIILVYLNCGF